MKITGLNSLVHRRLKSSQRGAALLMALIIMALIATLAAAMVWQQWRAIEVETAERARTQSAWILTGALDWARVILKEDNKSGNAVDHLGEPWAVPLAEARMSTFLAADENNTDDAPQTFLSGSITDAQSRYNLTNLINPADGTIDTVERDSLRLLCLNINISTNVADQIATSLQAAFVNSRGLTPPPGVDVEKAALMPGYGRTDQLSWLKIEPDALKRLEPYIVFLNNPTPVNINTASREVLAAVVPKIDLVIAQRLIQTRDRTPFEKIEDIQPYLPQGATPNRKQLSVTTNHFFVRGKVRIDNQALEQRSLVLRTGRGNGTRVTILTREWVNSHEGSH